MLKLQTIRLSVDRQIVLRIREEENLWIDRAQPEPEQLVNLRPDPVAPLCPQRKEGPRSGWDLELMRLDMKLALDPVFTAARENIFSKPLLAEFAVARPPVCGVPKAVVVEHDAVWGVFLDQAQCVVQCVLSGWS